MLFLPITPTYRVSPIRRPCYIPHNPPAVIGARGRNSSSWLPLLASHDASLASQAGHRPARQGQPARLARRAGRARPGPPGGPKRIHSRKFMNFRPNLEGVLMGFREKWIKKDPQTHSFPNSEGLLVILEGILIGFGGK